MRRTETLTIAGRRFRVELASSGDDPSAAGPGPASPAPEERVGLRCIALDPADEPLAETLNTGWILSPTRLVAGARDKEGFDFEGRVGVVFAEEAPDEFDGLHQVRVDYLDSSVVLPALEWTEFVGQVALWATEDRPEWDEVHEIAVRLLRL